MLATFPIHLPTGKHNPWRESVSAFLPTSVGTHEARTGFALLHFFLLLARQPQLFQKGCREEGSLPIRTVRLAKI